MKIIFCKIIFLIVLLTSCATPRGNAESVTKQILRHPDILLDYKEELSDYLHPILLYEEFDDLEYRKELIRKIKEFNKIDMHTKVISIEDIKEFEKKFNSTYKYDFSNLRPFYYTLCKGNTCLKFYFLYYNSDVFLFHINDDNPMNYR